ELIRAHFPDDGILGEEFDEVPSANGLRWVLDPLDGTRAFIAGQPMWGSLIALEENSAPRFGIIDQPFTRERFTGVVRSANGRREGSSELRDERGPRAIAVRACSSLSEAILTTTHPTSHFDAAAAAAFARVEKSALLSRYGGDCYGYALLAMGFVDVIIEAG